MNRLLTKEEKVEQLKSSDEANPLLKVAELNEHMEVLNRRVSVGVFIGTERLFSGLSVVGNTITHGHTGVIMMQDIGNGWCPVDTKHLRVKDLPLNELELCQNV